MNLLLIDNKDFIDQQTVRLSDRRSVHLKSVNRVEVGDRLNAGLINGLIGSLTVCQLEDNAILLRQTEPFALAPPKPLPIHLVIALPRPQMIKRILQTCATMGVKMITFIHSARVEKSFWQSPVLTKEKVKEELVLGLEQAKDTVLPKVFFEKDFNKFVRESLPELFSNTLGLIAHPKKELSPCPVAIQQETTLLIGPEGGFIESEIEQMEVAGGNCVQIGERILRVETAVTVLLARLFPL